MISFKLSTKFIKFCIVGTIGFLTEALIIHLVKVLYPDFLLYVRFISFPAALVVTWILNRVFVFESGNSKIKEVSKYALVQTFGAILNILVYTLLLLLSDFLSTTLFWRWPEDRRLRCSVIIFYQSIGCSRICTKQ